VLWKSRFKLKVIAPRLSVEPALHGIGWEWVPDWASRFNGCKWVYHGFMIRSDTIQITPEILSLISRIDEFKGAWRALGALAPDRLSALRRVATIESIGSSTRIEGSKLSDREVAQLLSKLEIRSFATRDEQEVAGYGDVMDLVFASWQDIPFTENHLK